MLVKYCWRVNVFFPVLYLQMSNLDVCFLYELFLFFFFSFFVHLVCRGSNLSYLATLIRKKNMNRMEENSNELNEMEDAANLEEYSSAVNEMEDPTNIKDKVKDPEVGAIFDSLEELAEYYKNYGKEKGFEVSKRTSSKGDGGELKYLTLACSRSGKSKCNSRNSLKLHPITKTDCQARVRASICLDGKWKVCSCVLEHNHELPVE